MGMTITKAPPAVIAALQPVIFRVVSDHVGYLRINGGIAGLKSSVEPDADNGATFNFADYVRDLPELNVSLSPGIHVAACPAVQFLFSERYGTPPADQDEFPSQVFHILRAKVPHWRNDFSGSIHAYINAVNPFLTWYSNQNRKVLPEEFIPLYMLCTSTGEFLWALNFEVDFTDNSSDSFYGEDTSAQVNKYDVIQFDASPSVVISWAATEHPGKVVKRYSVKAAYFDETEYIPFSEGRAFVINTTYYPHARQIVFRNSFNCFDTLMLRGSGSITANTDRITANQVTDFDTLPVPDRVTWYTKTRQTLTVETAYLLKAERRWLNELYDSHEIYLKSGTQLIPLELASEKLLQEHDDSALISVPLEFKILQTPRVD